MVKIKAGNIELTIKNATETVRMGGPYVGDVFIDDELMSKSCVANNFVYDEDLNLLFFIKHHHQQNYHYFTINFYNLTNRTLFEFDREFDMVYIKQFLNKNELEIFYAFHDQLPNTRDVFFLNNDDFRQI